MIISTVQAHKLLYSTRNKLKFWFIPSKVGVCTIFYYHLGDYWWNFANNYQVYIISCSFCYIILWVYAMSMVQKYIIKNHVKTSLMWNYTIFAKYHNIKSLHINCPSTKFPPKTQIQIFSHMHNKHNSTIHCCLLYNCSLIVTQ